MSPALPKAELHVHLEGTATPALIRKLAARNGARLPPDLFADENAFAWRDFEHFLTVYDMVSSVIRSPEDYRDVTYDYLARCAGEGVVYAELTSSPEHAAANGMSYADHLHGIAQGIDDARAEHGIEAYILVSCVRHFGLARAMGVVRDAIANPHPLVVGFNMAGDELRHPPGEFAPVFRLARDEAGLDCTVHAGEFDGPGGIREALRTLPVTRLGHGVRAIEDRELVAELADRGIVLECCPTSNIATGVYGSYADHPFLALRAAGCRVTLNSDDPPYFHASVGGEYDVAARHYALSRDELRDVTRTAIEAGFAPAAKRRAILFRSGLLSESGDATDA